MGNRTRLRASVVGLAAAVACFISPAFGYITIISSFPISGIGTPCARSVLSWSDYPTYKVRALFYGGAGSNFLYTMATNGSIISSVLLPNAISLRDADSAPAGVGDWAAIDEGTHQLKIYTKNGSYVGTFAALPADVIAYGRGGNTAPYIYYGTAAGTISRYTTAGSFLNSFSTGHPLGDLCAGDAYRFQIGDYVYAGPAAGGDPMRVYRTNGSLLATYFLPGVVNMGTMMQNRSFNGNHALTLRRVGPTVWAFWVCEAEFADVQPSSLGRVKAVYR